CRFRFRARQHRPSLGRCNRHAGFGAGDHLALSLFRAGAEKPMTTASRHARIGRIGLYTLLVWVCLFFSIPLLVVISTSLKTSDEVRTFSIFTLPAAPGIAAWIKAWSSACTGLNCGGVRVGFWNSVRILIPSVIISVLAGSITGYALSHWRIRGANA